jgi:hypothetical protein
LKETEEPYWTCGQKGKKTRGRKTTMWCGEEKTNPKLSGFEPKWEK